MSGKETTAGRATAGGRAGDTRWTRRGVVAASAAALGAGALPLPFVNRARAQGEPLRFWQFTAPGGPNPARVRWFTDMIAAWNNTQPTKIELEYIPNAQYINGTKLQTAFASGAGPDIFVVSPGDFLRYYNGGVLADLTPYMDAAAREDFFANVMATRMVDGKVYALPMEVEPMAFYYSKAAFEQAGLNETNIPRTWDELIELGRRLTTKDRFGVLFETTPGYYQNFTWYPFLWQSGGEIVAPQGDRSAFGGPGAAQALKLWQDAVAAGAAPRKPLGYGANDIVANLGSGYCAIQNCGIWGVSAMREGAPDFPYGVFRLPVPAGGRAATIAGGWSFVANAEGKDPETAARFCVWALGSMGDDSIARVTDWCTKAKSDVPPRRSAMDRGKAAGAFGSGPMQAFLDDIFPASRSEPRVPPQLYKAVSDAIQAVQLGGADPAAQAEAASRQIDSFLAGYSGAPIV